MIELKNVSKTFVSNSGVVEAVKNTSLTINDGEIFGFIGYSGAGKSTIVRIINLLENPNSGQVIIDGIDLTKLSDKELRQKRKKIGMIFQHFNLLNSLTVHDNVAFNLRGLGLSKAQINEKVKILLDLVSISEKQDAYPSQLSGGQKQRVAIARALANDPDILLCDESTSALDPQTTSQILDLLRNLNEKLGITIIVITHEMHVIKSICDRVAVMEDGYVVEIDHVFNIFAKPQTSIAREFVNSTSNKETIINLINKNPGVFGLDSSNKVLYLDFQGANTKDSVISKISRDYNLDCSIIFGDVDVIKNQMLGQLIVSLKGEVLAIEESKKYLNEQGIRWEEIN